MSSQNSTYELIKDLCKCIHTDCTDTAPTEKFLRRTKSLAYEILLKKSNKINELRNDQPFDPFDELNFLEFQMHYTCKNDIERECCRKFENCLNLTKDDLFFQTDLGQSILRFLITLEGSICVEDRLIENVAPGCLMGTYFLNNYNTTPYRIIPLERMRFPAAYKQIFGPNISADIIKNPYFPKFLKQNKNNKRFFTLPLNRGGNEQKHNTEYLSLPGTIKQISDGTETDSRREKTRNILWNSRTWECLGEAAEDDPIAAQFASENQSSLLHLFAVHSKVIRTRFSAKLVEIPKIIADIKYLVIGIRSEAFFDDPITMCFSMATHLTIPNVLPQTFAGFVQEFLECGSCYARLQSMCNITPQNFDLKFNGFVFRVS